MKTIAPAELQKLLAAQPGLPLLDVRTPVEYAGVHVPQARNVPLDQLSPKALFDADQLPKGQPVYLLCRSGGGGTQAWIEAGLPVTGGTTRVISLERQVRIAAGSLVLAGVLLGWFVHGGFFGLSAFVGAGLVFAGVTDWCGMGLLLAKLPWNQKSGCASGSGCEVKH
jgi:rhodanese-related sulfurtransferase